MKVPHDELIRDWIRYTDIKRLIQSGDTRQVIDMAMDENTIRETSYLMSWESLSLVEAEILDMAKGYKEDDNIEQLVEMLAIVNKRMKEY
jgi:hypothetical protein